MLRWTNFTKTTERRVHLGADSCIRPDPRETVRTLSDPLQTFPGGVRGEHGDDPCERRVDPEHRKSALLLAKCELRGVETLPPGVPCRGPVLDRVCFGDDRDFWRETLRLEQ